MANIKEVLVRAESTINCFWTITFEDGTVSEYWSCDQGAVTHIPSDTSLWDTNPTLCDFLQNLWYGMEIDEEEDAVYMAIFNPQGVATKAWTENP